MEQRIQQWVANHLDEGMQLVKKMYDHPEIGNQEFESMELLCKELEQLEFETTRHYLEETGFLGRYTSNKPGPVIAFLCEYDALPEVGHGCGHNLIAAIGVLAGGALKSVIDELGGEVRVVGTPAEENFGGKVKMTQKGAFDNVDVAMMIHPGTKNGLGGRTCAIQPVKFEFFGKNAHGCHPEEGRSALDAAVSTYMSINMQRQIAAPGSFIHGIIRDGGLAANVIPAYASLEYYFRAPTMKYALELARRAEEAAKGASLASETTMKASVYECPYEDFKINYTLCDALKQEYKKLGIEDIEEVDETPVGSSDIGAVSYHCPALHGNIKIATEEVTGHSREMAAATISPQGKQALELAATSLARLATRLVKEPQLLAMVKSEFHRD